jgi:cytochrome c peroxidase
MIIAVGLIALVALGLELRAVRLDQSLAELMAAWQFEPLDPGPAPPPALVTLGQALYFDKELSGNRDISCATCHHPQEHTTDGLPLSIGTGGRGLGPDRIMGDGRRFIPRNAPDVFNRGSPAWRTIFWDGRASQRADGSLISPAGNQLPAGLTGILAVQAMFPVTSRDEMRGAVNDRDAFGRPNELAALSDEDYTAIWRGIMARLLAIPEYASLFQTAYPNMPPNQLGFQHAANAIAAFEMAAYTLTDSPWDRYLAGDREALSNDAKQGALIFFGKGQCSACHAPPLFSEQLHHNLAIPQIGPGKDDYGHDYGRYTVTGVEAQKYAFRTPPLRNVTLTGPWAHNGAFSSLEAMIRHHLDPAGSLRSYDPAQHLPPDLALTFRTDEALLADMLAHLDPRLAQIEPLSNGEIKDLLAFLAALADPAARNLGHTVPDRVPSGLPVAG